MEFFRIKKDIPFMKHALVFNVISALTFVAAVFFLWQRGLHLSLEFTGGTSLEVRYAQAPDLDKLRTQIEQLGFGEPVVGNIDNAENVQITLPVKKGVEDSTISNKVFDKLCASAGGNHSTLTDANSAKREACVNAAGTEVVSLRNVDFRGPQVGDELAIDGVKALLAVVVGVIAYLAIRFEWKFAISAIIANLHDVVIIMGFFAFFQWEFSLSVLAGVLAVLGYSVNESVVIFDRIRENFRKQRKSTVVESINSAITGTISRTVITHGCTQMMVLAMLIFGGPTLHNFALALTIGICFGIYSSVFVAAAMAMWFGVKREDLIKAVKATDEHDGAVV